MTLERVGCSRAGVSKAKGENQMKDSSIVLFSTEYCTLCTEALELLFSMPELQGCSLDVVDISGNDELLRRYGERLPVVRAGAHELDWPFGRAEILCALGKIEQR